jgi:RHS repeat-associated protein
VLEQRQLLSVSPVAEWKLTDGSGTSVADSSGNGETGTITGSGSSWTTSARVGGEALDLGTSGAYISSADTSLPSGNTARTVSLWFNTAEIASAATGYYGLFSYGAASADHAFGLFVNKSSSGVLTIFVTNYGANVTGTIALTANSWNHLAVSYNGTNAALYVNGVADTSGSFGTTLSTTTSGTSAYTGAFLGSGNAVRGALDDVRVYSQALTTAEIDVLNGPAAPTATGGSGSVSLNWTSLSGATSYNVYRSTTPGGEGLTAYATGITSASYTDSSVTNGTRYYYKVSAVGDVGEGALSSAEANAWPHTAAMPVAHWALTDGLGTSVADSSGNAENGTITGSGYSWTTSARVGGVALSFGASSAYVSSPDADLPSGNTARTVSLWFNTTAIAGAATGYYGLFSYGAASTNNAFGLFINKSSSGVLTIFVTNYGANVTGTIALTANSWNHLAVTYNGTTATLYVNGAADTSGSFGSSLNTTVSGKSAYIGAFLGGGNAVRGAIDDVRVYDRALAAGEIAVLNGPSLTATSGTGSSVSLSWTSVSSATSYDVYRSTTPGGEGTTPYATGLTTTSYTDSTSGYGGYYYTVSAVGSNIGEGTPSVEKGATPTAAAGWWPLTDGSGGAPADISGNGENGTLHGGGYSWTSADPFGNSSLNLGSSGAYVQSADTSLPSGNSARTISLWFNTTSMASAAANFYGLFAYGAASADNTFGLLLNKSSTGTLTIFATNFGTNITGAIALLPNAWNHLAVSYDGANATLYVNGVADTSGSFGASLNTTVSSVSAYIGAFSASHAAPGLFGDVRVYGQALTATQIGTLSAEYLAPTHASVTPISDTVAEVDWTPSPGATHYIIERSVNGGATTTLATLTSASASGYDDDSLSPDDSVDYTVVAANDAGASASDPSATMPNAQRTWQWYVSDGTMVFGSGSSGTGGGTFSTIASTYTSSDPAVAILADSKGSAVATYTSGTVVTVNWAPNPKTDPSDPGPDPTVPNNYYNLSNTVATGGFGVVVRNDVPATDQVPFTPATEGGLLPQNGQGGLQSYVNPLTGIVVWYGYLGVEVGSDTDLNDLMAPSATTDPSVFSTLTTDAPAPDLNATYAEFIPCEACANGTTPGGDSQTSSAGAESPAGGVGASQTIGSLPSGGDPSAGVGASNAFPFMEETADTTPALAVSEIDLNTSGSYEYFTTQDHGNNYQEVNGGTDTVQAGGDNLTYATSDGTTMTFYAFSDSIADNLQGKWISTQDADGTVTQVASRDSDGNPTNVTVTDGSGQETENWNFTQGTTGASNGRMVTADEQQKDSGGSWQTVRQVSYTYADGSDDTGMSGDLKSVTVTDGSGNVLDGNYYRYYTAGETGGLPHQLEYGLGLASIQRVESAFGTTDLDSLTDAQIAPYADLYQAYNTAGQIVTRAIQGDGCSVCSSGIGTYSYSYATNPNSTTDYNSWRTKVVTTNPDGSQNITYSDTEGLTMLSIDIDPATGVRNATFTAYDSNGNVILTAQPSAVNLPTSLSTLEQYEDLLNQTGTSSAGYPEYQYLNSSSGLINLTDYYTSTTATSGTPGGVNEYEKDAKIEQGDSGTPILQSSMDYYANVAGGVTIYPSADSTQYRNTNGTGAETTSYSYTFFSGSNQMETQSTTLPTISTSQNGNGVASVSTDYYDQTGQVIWSVDANGYITYNAYDPVTRALTETIQDVDPSSVSGAPVTGPTRSGSLPTALNLTTTYGVDYQGRTTETTDPDGNVTYTVYNDALDPTTGFIDEVRTYPGWHQDPTSGLWTTTGPVQVTRTNDPGSYDETLTYAYTPVSGVTAPTGTDTISNIQSLSRDILDNSGQTIESDAYFNLTGLTYSSSSATLGTAGTNYYPTLYGYDEFGRQNHVVDPTGNITDTIYDGFGRAIATWQGTDDVPTSDLNGDGYINYHDFIYAVTTTGTAPAGTNMVETSSTIYDNGGSGDGNVTEQISYPGSGQPARATANYYDWRDRLVASKMGALVNSGGTLTPTAETDGVARPITYTTYDNLGEAVEQQSFDGDGVTISTTSGVPNAPNSSLLTAETVTSYDDQGRTFETQEYSVDPTTASVSTTAETSLTFYDPDGNVIAQSSPTGAWTKTAYDGADRATAVYTTDGGVVNGATPGYAEASSVTNDVVLSETDTTYDNDGNAIETVESARLPTASTTATGTLTSADARISYGGSWFDAADRDIADENVGTNGGTAWTRPSSPDSSDATHLVTTYGYDAAGNQDTVTDPAGIVTQTYFDALGRQTEVIDDYTNGVPTDSSNQTTAYTYDGDGDILTQTAVEPAGTPNQTTAYIYNSTSGIFSNTLLTTVEYPDATTGSASTSPSDDMTYTYDALGEKISMTDQNGTTHAYSYDGLGRQTLDAVTTLGTGVDGSVMALGTTYNAQGLPFQETSYASANGTGVVNQDEDIYNGLGQLTAEYQSVSGPVTVGTTPEVQYGYSSPATGSVQTSMTYPNGRVIDYTYNSGVDAAVGLVSGIADAAGSDAGNLQSYTYLGAGTILGEVDGNGVTETTTLDNFGRTSELDYVNGSGTTTDDFQYGYDQDGNVLYQFNGVNNTFSQLYTYDSLNRLTGYQQGVLNSSATSIVGTPTASQTWTYDALGNQDTVTTNGTATTNATNSKNELTASGSSSLAYDNDGNTLTDENGQTYTYNAWNQMVSTKNAAGATLATYTYDPQGRRITDTEAGTTTDIYYDTQWQDIEERQGGTVTRQNVWGLEYVNELVERDDNSVSGSLGISSSGLGERLYAQQDANWSVVSLADASGDVVQRATFTPYGLATFLTASFSPTADAYNQDILFQGGRLETATGQYIFQARDYDPSTGTWNEPDPSGYSNGSNLFLAFGDNPIVAVDPLGLKIVLNEAASANSYSASTHKQWGEAQAPVFNYEDFLVADYEADVSDSDTSQFDGSNIAAGTAKITLTNKTREIYGRFSVNTLDADADYTVTVSDVCVTENGNLVNKIIASGTGQKATQKNRDGVGNVDSGIAVTATRDGDNVMNVTADFGSWLDVDNGTTTVGGSFGVTGQDASGQINYQFQQPNHIQEGGTWEASWVFNIQQ